MGRQIPLQPDAYNHYDKIIEALEKLKTDYSTNPHLVQLVGEDHGYIVEVYFHANPDHREFFWIKHPELLEMAVQLTRELAVVACTICHWTRSTEIFVAQQFLKKVRFNNIPNLVSAATLDRPILPKNKITEFVQYELGRHFREKHNAIHAGNSSPENEQENSKTELPQEHPTDNQSSQGPEQD